MNRKNRGRPPGAGAGKSRDIPPLQKPKMSKTELQSLEPSEADFRRRDAAGLCIDCGEAPQPARRAGEAKTPKHHRCDPCRRVYGSRQELRRLLCDTNHLHYVADVPDAVCSWCGQPIAIDVFHYSYPAPEPATSLRRACDRCVHDARFEIAPAASVVQVDVLPFDTGSGRPFMAVSVPVGVPALFALGVSFVGLWEVTESHRQGSVRYQAECEHVRIVVVGVAGDSAGVERVADIVRNVSAVALAVHLPGHWKRVVRGVLYDTGPDGQRAARRLRALAPTAASYDIYLPQDVVNR